ALLAADEAGVAAARQHREVRVRPLVEGAGPAPHAARLLELHVLADDRDDVRRGAHLLHHFVGDHASSTTVTPAPPSFHAPMRCDFTRLSPLSNCATRSRSAPVPLPWMIRSACRSARCAASIACTIASSTSCTRMPRKSTSVFAITSGT